VSRARRALQERGLVYSAGPHGTFVAGDAGIQR
jgi:DNA-binding transcriptional regulator YhcF (GntR family)